MLQRPFGSNPQPMSARFTGAGAQRPFGSMLQPSLMHWPSGSMLQPVFAQGLANKAQARSRRAQEAGAVFADLELLSARGLAAEAVQGVARRARTRRTASLRRVGMEGSVGGRLRHGLHDREGRSRENVHSENITYARYGG